MATGVAKRTQHVAPNNVARCCVKMLRAFSQAFIVSKHSVLNSLLYKMTRFNLQSMLIAFFTFKDVDSIFCRLFVLCDQFFDFTITRLKKTSCFFSMSNENFSAAFFSAGFVAFQQ